MCGFLERFNPAMIVARQMLRTPWYVRAERHSPYVPRIKTGVAWDLLVHDVDLVVQLLGAAPEGVNVQLAQFHPKSLPGAEDLVEATLAFPSGAVASVSASRLSQRKVRTMVIQGLDRMIEVDLLRRGVTAYRHATIEAEEEGYGGYRQMTEIEVPDIVGAEPLVTQLEHFVALIDGRADLDHERASILPSHAVVEKVLDARAR